MLVMVIAVAGWFYGDDAARGQVFEQAHQLIGDDAAASIRPSCRTRTARANAAGLPR